MGADAENNSRRNWISFQPSSQAKISTKIYLNKDFVSHYPGVQGTKVSNLGAGMVGSMVIELLKPLQMDSLFFSLPNVLLSPHIASSMGSVVLPRRIL